MNISDKINSIFPVVNNKKAEEKFTSYELSYETTLDNLTEIDLSTFINSLPTTDFIKITISIFDEPITLTSELKNYTEFITKVNEEKHSIENEKINFKLSIVKNSTLDVLSVYDFQSFCSFWKSLTLEIILDHFSNFLKPTKRIKFLNVFDSENEFYTENIIFTHQAQFLPQQNSNIEISKIRSNCHFENFERFPFTSYYFRLLKRPTSENPITKSLDKLSFIFCITGLFDITSINSSTLYSKLNGYKSLEFTDNMNDIDISSNAEYQNIYDWVHSEQSHVTDKIGLSRNIISIYLRDKSYSITDSVFTSIKSGFKTYLQQNINRYIDIRNKIGDQVSSISEKANDLAEKYLTNYQKSNFAFISFFISIFLLKVLSTSKFENIFTKDTTILFFALLGISIVYFIFSLITFNQDKKRLNTTYFKLKSRHEDLLDKEDINNILRRDEEFNDDMIFLKKRRNSYSLLWVLTILIFISAILSLSTYINWTIFKCVR